MRVLGIDPGLTRCGIGIVDVAPNRTATLVSVSVVRTAATDPLEERLLTMADAFASIVEQFQPERMALERVFAQHNVSTVMGVAQVSGIVLMTAARNAIPIGLHTPSEVKAAVTGYGSADKAQVGAMVAKILGLKEAPKPADAADALAIALCHAWRTGPIPRATTTGEPAGMTAAQRAWRAAEQATGSRASGRRLTR